MILINFWLEAPWTWILQYLEHSLAKSLSPNHHVLASLCTTETWHSMLSPCDTYPLKHIHLSENMLSNKFYYQENQVISQQKFEQQRWRDLLETVVHLYTTHLMLDLRITIFPCDLCMWQSWAKLYFWYIASLPQCSSSVGLNEGGWCATMERY